VSGAAARIPAVYFREHTSFSVSSDAMPRDPRPPYRRACRIAFISRSTEPALRIGIRGTSRSNSRSFSRRSRSLMPRLTYHRHTHPRLALRSGYLANRNVFPDHDRGCSLEKGDLAMPQHNPSPLDSVLPPRCRTPAASTRELPHHRSLLEQWSREDATNDPATVAQAEQELAQFKAGLNANRPPERTVFP
jgi:hypothetical protein